MRRRVRKIQDAELAATLRSGLEQGSYSVVDAIRVMRVLEGISQETLAKRSGLSKNVIKMIEAGHGNPVVSTLENIAASFDLGASTAHVAPPRCARPAIALELATVTS